MSTTTTPREKCVDDIVSYLVEDIADAAGTPDGVRLMRLALDVARWGEGSLAVEIPPPVAS